MGETAMNPNWRGFVERIGDDNDPRNLANLIVNYLSPPVYAKEALRKFEYLCDFCFKPRIDQCAVCGKSVSEEHSKEYKLKFLWYLCPACQNNPENEEQIKTQDEEFAESEFAEEEEASVAPQQDEGSGSLN